RTMSVEVKALVINDRQVTLALYRQLRDEQIVYYRHWDDGTASYSLRGTPWGWVNHHTDACKQLCKLQIPHLHVVWQLGDKLRVAVVKEWAGLGDTTLEVFEDTDPREPGQLIEGWDVSYVDDWEEMYGRLAKLDHLFIAS